MTTTVTGGLNPAVRGAAWYASTVRAVLASLERDAERAALLANLAPEAAA